MFKRALAVFLSLVMLVLAIPFTSFAKGKEQEVTAKQAEVKTQEDIEINTAENTLNYDQSWEELYPNGTFAFASLSGTITEGADDSKSSLRIPVYRLGGIDGVATAIIKYFPMVTTQEDGSVTRTFAISSKKDIKLYHEDANPISKEQPIAYPKMNPAPYGVYIDMQDYTPDEDEEVSEYVLPKTLKLTFYDDQPELSDCIWQYKNIGENDRCWRSIDESNSPDFSVNLIDILDDNMNPLFDYRVIYKTKDGYFCSPTAFYGEEYVPESSNNETLQGIETNKVNTFTEYQPKEEYEAYEFPLTFADGEFVKYIDVSALNDNEYEVDKFANFIIYECIGGQLSSISNTFSLTLKDDDISDMRESTIGFTANKVTASKDKNSIKIELKREGDLRYMASVHYTTVDNTAKAGVNYTKADGDVMFMPGTELGYFEIPLISSDAKKNIDFKIELSDIKGGEGKCKLGKSELTVVISPGLKALKSQSNGIVGAGNNLQSMLAMSNGIDMTANMQTDSTSLLNDNSEIEPKIEAAPEIEELYADIVENANDGDPNTYDYSNIQIRRSPNYDKELNYWKDYETPYYDGNNGADYRYSDIADYALSEPTFVYNKLEQHSYNRKTKGVGGFEANYHTKTPAKIEIPHAGYLFDSIYYHIKVNKCAVCHRFLLWMYNYTMPWTRITIEKDGHNYYAMYSNFGPQENHNKPLTRDEDEGTIGVYDFIDSTFNLTLNTTLNNLGVTSEIPEKGAFRYVPGDKTSISLNCLKMHRRVFQNTDNIALRIYTSNDADTENYVVNENVYNSIKPNVSLVSKAGGVNASGNLYVGSKLKVELKNSSSFIPLNRKNAEDTVFVTTLDGTKVPAKIEKENETPVYYITFLWENMNADDLQKQFRINVVYERNQNVNLDITPSLIRDDNGNQKYDKESITKSWEEALAGAHEATITYSAYDPTNSDAKGGYVTKSVKKSIEELFGTETNEIRTLQNKTKGFYNIQKINFGFSDKDKILFNGEIYAGDETIELKADEITAEDLNFILYKEKYLGFESKMNITMSTIELYFDGNGNGKIDGYYDESAGLFMLDKDSGDICYGKVKGKIPETIIEPQISGDGKVLQYFFKVFYNITPRALLSEKKDTAQILPCFIPQDTDETSLAKLTSEQRAYRLITTSGTSVLPYDKKSDKTGKKYDIADTAEGHLMYGAEASKRAAIDFPLGGDMRAYKGGKVNGKEIDINDYCGNLRFNFTNTENILYTTTKGTLGTISDVNGYVGSFINRTSFICGVQPTRELKSNDDFVPETVANSNMYAVPANNVSSSLGGLSATKVGENIGSPKQEQTKVLDYNSTMQLPQFSFSGFFGFDFKSYNGNKMMISFGIPINLIHSSATKVYDDEAELEDGKKEKNKSKSVGDKNVNEKQVIDKDNNPIKEEKSIEEKNVINKSDGSQIKNESKIKIEKDLEKGTEKRIIEIKKEDGGKVDKYQKELDVSNDDSSDDEDDAFNKKQNEDSKTEYFKGDVINGISHIPDLKDFLKKISNGDLKKEYKKIKALGDGAQKERTFDLDLNISAYVIFEYNELNGGWGVSSAAISVGLAVSLNYKFRFGPMPLIYILVNVNPSGSVEWSWDFERTYDAIGDILKEEEVLTSGDQKIEFVTDISDPVGGLRIDFYGKILLSIYKDGEKTPIIKGRLGASGQTDIKIKPYGKVRVVIQPENNERVTVKSIKTVGTKLKSKYNEASFFTELGINVGAGVGLGGVSAEIFLNGNGKFTTMLQRGGESFIKDFSARIALTVRAKLILFNFTFDLVGMTWTGSREKKGQSMTIKRYFSLPTGTGPDGPVENNEGGIDILEPQSSAAQQQIFEGISDPNSARNAFHPTDETVKFELSGYGTSGDAFKLADRLDSGYQSKAFVMNGETYLLYTISDPDSKHNGINASRLALSKIVINADDKNRGLANPISENSSVPYIFVDSQDMGNLSFAYAVNGTKLDVVYTGYNKHFNEEKITVQDANQHIVVRKASIDIAKEGVTGFDPSQVISENAGIYRFSPVSGSENAYYAETIANKGKETRLENMRAYLKAVYGINEEDYTSSKPAAEKIQSIYRYKMYESNNTLNGDGSQLVAVNKDGERIVTLVGQNSGEVINEIKVQNIDGKDVLIYLTNQEAYFDTDGSTLSKEQFNAETDYAIITRMYARSFDGKEWSEPMILSQAVDFEKCSESNINDYPLTDGLYSNGLLQEAFANPSVSNIDFLLADLDGSKEIKPILTVEVNGNTLLLDNKALCNLIEGKAYEAKPIFNTEMGTSMQITTDAEGNLLLSYIRVMEGTENNAVYCAWWDKNAGSWGEANILAMNHMSVYENIYKYSLGDEQAKKAYHGEETGNEAYDKAVKEGKASTGAYDRFVFKEIQLLPTQTKEQYEDESHNIINEKLDGLMLLCKGNYYTLKKDTMKMGEGEESYSLDVLKVDKDYGCGFYAVPFSEGDASIGKASITFNKEDFACGSTLSGKLYFTNTGTAAIRGSNDQPIKLQLIAENKEKGFKQIVGDYRINSMIASGKEIAYDFLTQPLQIDLPDDTEFKILVSEDEEYAKKSGGVAFNRLSDSIFTVKKVSDIRIEQMQYEVVDADDDSVYIATDFVIANHGSEHADNLFMQYSVSEKDDDNTSKPIDITGTELYVDRETEITEKNTNDDTDKTDLSRGVIALKDKDGSSSLSPGYMRSVIGIIKVKKTDFEAYSKAGMRLRAEVFSQSDSYTESNDVDEVLYTKISTQEYSSSDARTDIFIPQKTEFNVPANIHMNLNNTLRVPISYNSTATQDDIVVREISNGEDDWTSLFNDLHYTYDQNQHAIVAVAKTTGNTVIQIENRATNTIRNLVVDIDNYGFGVNIFNNDDSFKFYNKNGEQITPTSTYKDWKFDSNVDTWKGENEPPMANDICTAAEGASVKFSTVATTVNVFFSGRVRVTSDKFDKVFELKNTGTKPGGYVAARFDNLEGIQHEVTITSLEDDTEIDRYTASYPEESGITIRKNDYSPMIYWARSFPNTASIREGRGTAKINCYFADESELALVKFNGEDITKHVTRHSNRLWSFEFVFTENGEYILEITDSDGNVTIQKIKVYWFNSILNRDAIPDAPDFELENTNLIDEKGKDVGEDDRSDTLKIGVKYDTQYSHFGEEFTAYSCFDQNFDKKVTKQNITDQGERQYQRMVDAPINGFYVIRDVAQNGTWSIAMIDVHQNSKAKPTCSMKLVSPSKTENYLQIDYDATTSGISRTPTIMVNGYKLPLDSFKDGRASLRFNVEYSGEYHTTFYDGYELYSLSENINLPLYTVGDIMYEKAYNLWADKWQFIIDPSNIRGQFYDKLLSDPEHNEYVNSNLLCYQYGSNEYKVNWVIVSPNSTTDVKIYKSPETKDDYIPLSLTAPEAPKSRIVGNPFTGENVFVKLPDGIKEQDVQFQWMKLNHRNDGTKVYSEFADIKDANSMYYRLTNEDVFRLIFCKVTYNGKSEIIKMPLIALPSLNNSYKLTYNGEKQTLDYLSVLEYFAGDEKVALKIICEELGSEMEGKMLLSGNEATDVGDYVCKVSFKDNPEFDFDIKWSILPVDISEATITVDRMVYNGKEQTCIPHVTLNGFDQVDYDITGNKATAPGVYEMTLTGKGNFTGTVKVKWSISQDIPQTGVKPEFVIIWLILLLSSLILIVNLLYRKKYKK